MGRRKGSAKNPGLGGVYPGFLIGCWLMVIGYWLLFRTKPGFPNGIAFVWMATWGSPAFSRAERDIYQKQ